ncbi:MAG: bacteriohemerythrin [Noviherbaspirillum sp.]
MFPPSNWMIDTASGLPAMDQLHHEFLETLNDLSTRQDREFRERYAAFVAKLEQVFRQEEQWMEDIDFPMLKIHREQHARVLGALHHLHSRLMGGEITIVRTVVEQLLPQWFAFHASTMDASLARAMQMTEAEAVLRATGRQADRTKAPAAPTVFLEANAGWEYGTSGASSSAHDR